LHNFEFPRGSRKLAHEGSKVVSHKRGRDISQQIFLLLVSVTDWVEPRAIER
jgi:hypothetical protein